MRVIQHRNLWLASISALIAMGAFLIDIVVLPLEMREASATGIRLGTAMLLMYLASLLPALWLPQWRHVLYAAFSISALFLFVPIYVLFISTDFTEIVIPRRIVGLSALWLVAAVAMQSKRGKQIILKLNTNLETRVAERADQYRQAEEAVRRSESLLKEAQEIARIGNWEVDCENDNVFWSEQMYKIMDIDPAVQPSYEMVMDKIHPEDQERVRGDIERSLSGQGAYAFDLRIVLTDGTERALHAQGTVATDQTGQPIRLAGTVQDITERKNLEKQLVESIERYELAERGTNDGIWDWNIQTGEDHFSPRWKEILGYGIDELSPTIDTFTDLLHPDDRDRAWKAVEAHLTRKTPYDLEVRMLHKNGEFVWVRARGQAIWDEANNPLRMAGSISDITDRRRAEREIVVAGERERSRLGYNLHDGLGQELTGISLGLQLLTQKLSREQSTHIQTVQKLQSMTQKSISETRLIARTLSPSISSELGVDHALRLLAQEVNEHTALKCHVHCLNESDIQDSETATQLYRIAQEAINNALKHGNARNIEIHYGSEENTVYLEVLDDGIGIPAEHERIEGLGLRSMRYRAHMINGALDVTTRAKGGTRVRCSFNFSTCPS